MTYIGHKTHNMRAIGAMRESGSKHTAHCLCARAAVCAPTSKSTSTTPRGPPRIGAFRAFDKRTP
eukprot:scaffold17714_cov115-Isochrysis_galbana.AAC.1